MASNQVSINMEQVFKLEDDYEKSRDERAKEIAELQERRLKRIAVVEKYKEELNAMIVGKQKGIRFRKFFLTYVKMVAYKVFESEDQEYDYVGKAGRLRYTDIEEQTKAYLFKKGDPMFPVIGEIMTEFGCFDY